MPYDGKVPVKPKKAKARWRRHGEEGKRKPGESNRQRAKRLNQRYSRTSLSLDDEEWARLQAYCEVNGKPAGTLIRDIVMNEVAEWEETNL
jgi:hypothetical protein